MFAGKESQLGFFFGISLLQNLNISLKMSIQGRRSLRAAGLRSLAISTYQQAEQHNWRNSVSLWVCGGGGMQPAAACCHQVVVPAAIHWQNPEILKGLDQLRPEWGWGGMCQNCLEMFWRGKKWGVRPSETYCLFLSHVLKVFSDTIEALESKSFSISSVFKVMTELKQMLERRMKDRFFGFTVNTKLKQLPPCQSKKCEADFLLFYERAKKYIS